MEKIIVNVPAMYGDHHVLAVRQLLGMLPGVTDIYASSAFKQLVVTFDPAQVQAAAIERLLADNGYVPGAELPTPVWAPGQQPGPRFVPVGGGAPTATFRAATGPLGGGGPRPCPGFEFRDLAPDGNHPGDR